MNRPTAAGRPAALSERRSAEEVQDARRKVLLDSVLMIMLDAMPDSVLVLNRERQVLAVNTHLLEVFGISSDSFIGKRPGEALGCLFATESSAGCGADVHCATCGAVRSILESQRSGERTVHECHLTVNRDRGAALDLKVFSTPVMVDDIPLTVCVLQDISAEKRRGVLERVFFHDVLNTVGGIRGIASLLAVKDRLDAANEALYKHWMLELSERLIEEINHQRKLLAAERGEFKPDLSMVSLRELMEEVHALYVHHDIAVDRILQLEPVPDGTIISDGAILRRILGNLVKNALEATDKGGTVTFSCQDGGDAVTFSVHNSGAMPQEVQLQLFQRSFSTKGGDGRGIGTYSVKLFGERYLKGKVDFVSREPEGTTFRLTVSKNF